MEFVYQHLTAIAWIVAALLLVISYKWVLWLFGVIIVPDDSIGVVTKKFVLLGTHKSLPAGKIIALNGEAGFQADTLAPGLHVATSRKTRSAL